MQRSFKYYINVISLRVWALWYLFMERIIPSITQKRQQKLLENYDFKAFQISAGLLQEDGFYYTYSYFKTHKDFEHTMVRNDDNIVINPYSTVVKREKPGILFPAYYGLVTYNTWTLSKDESLLTEIKAHGLFILDFIDTDGGIKIWQDATIFNIKAPWYSGITQGIVTSFLIRCHMLFPSLGFDKKLKSIIDFMFDESHPKSMVAMSKEGRKWIDEYPSKPPSLVLNGFIFSIISLVEYADISNDQKYKDIALSYLDNMVVSLHRYVYPVGVKHNLNQYKFGNINYQALHCFQFYHLYRITKNKFFYTLANQTYKLIDWNLFCDFYSLQMDAKFYKKKNIMPNIYGDE